MTRRRFLRLVLRGFALAAALYVVPVRAIGRRVRGEERSETARAFRFRAVRPLPEPLEEGTDLAG